MSTEPTEPDDFDDDTDDEEDEEEEQFDLPPALLAAAGIESDEDFDSIPAAKPNVPVLQRLKRAKSP